MRVVVKVFVATVVFWYHTVMNTVNQLAKKYGLELVLLFGSRADGSHREKSDFDIAYLSRPNLDLTKESELIVDLMPLLKSNHIDLVNLKTAPPLLYYAIFKNSKVLYEKQPLLFVSLRVYAFKKYIEAKPLYEERFRRIKKFLSTKS